MSITLDKILQVLMWLAAFIISGSVHEFFHALSAWKCGDDTAKREGRLTLNPIAHIDIFGSIAFPLLGIFSGFVIGWMKPVPVNRYHLRHPSRDYALTSFAGPFSNLLQASLWLVLMKLLVDAGMDLNSIIFRVVFIFFQINLFLMVFNLLPVPPLDGGGILRHFLPPRAKEFFDQYIRYGFIVLFILLFIGGFEYIFAPVFSLIYFIVNNIQKTPFLIFCIPAVVTSSIVAFFLKDDIKNLFGQ